MEPSLVQPSAVDPPQRRVGRLRKRAILVQLPVLVALLFSALWVLRAFDVSAQASQRIIERHKTIRDATAFLKAVVDAETGQRGFVITGNEVFLEPYSGASAEVLRRSLVLRDLVRDDPKQLARIDASMQTFEEWLVHNAEPVIALRRASPPGPPTTEIQQRIASQAGKHRTDRIRSEIDAFLRRENEQLEAERLVAQRAVRTGSIVALAAPVLAFAITLMISLLASLRTVRVVEDVVEAAEQLADRNRIGTRVRIERNDELGRLGRAFNTLAQRLEIRDRESALLAETDEMLQVCATFGEACQVTATFMERLTGAPSGVLSIYNNSRNLVTPLARWGDPQSTTSEPFAPVECWALRRGKPHHSRPSTPELVCPHLATAAPVDHLCVPILAQGEPLGSVTLSLGTESNEDEVSRLTVTAIGKLALTLANLRLRDSLRDQSLRDPLTGLFNRRYLDETLQRELSRSHRTGRQLSVLVIDVDHFKRFNDTHGHEAGDAVLATVGRLLATNVRGSDIPCRFGGEEFVVVLLDAGPEAAADRAEQLRRTLSEQRVTHAGKHIGPVTASIGIAAFPVHATERHALLAAADAALYTAKRTGRDRVCIASRTADPAPAAASPPELTTPNSADAAADGR